MTSKFNLAQTCNYTNKNSAFSPNYQFTNDNNLPLLFFRRDNPFWAVQDGYETVTRVTLEPCRCEKKLEKAGLLDSRYALRDGESCGSTEFPFVQVNFTSLEEAIPRLTNSIVWIRPVAHGGRSRPCQSLVIVMPASQLSDFSTSSEVMMGITIFHPARGTAGRKRGKQRRQSPTSAAFCQITLVPFLFAHFQVGRHSGPAVESMGPCGSASSGSRNPRNWW